MTDQIDSSLHNDVMCEKMTNQNFKLNAFMKKIYYTEKKTMVKEDLIKEEAQQQKLFNAFDLG